MAKSTYSSKEFRSHNKSDKPDNIVKPYRKSFRIFCVLILHISRAMCFR